MKTLKTILLYILLFTCSNVFAQVEHIPEKYPPLAGLFLIDITAPLAEVSELHVGYEVALNRNKKGSVLFEGFVGLAKRNLIDEVSLLQTDQRYTKFDPSKRNFGLGIHLRKYGFNAPHSWYIGPFISFKRYHFKVSEGYCAGDNIIGCDVAVRNLTVKAESTRFGVDFGFNKKLSELFFINVSSETGVLRVNNKRSIPYSFPVDDVIFVPGGRNDLSSRELLTDPGGPQPLDNTRGFVSFYIALGFAIR